MQVGEVDADDRPDKLVVLETKGEQMVEPVEGLRDGTGEIVVGEVKAVEAKE